jgi:hypothetical protein
VYCGGFALQYYWSWTSSQDEFEDAAHATETMIALLRILHLPRCQFRPRLRRKYWLCCPKEFDEACRDCHAFIDHFVRLALSGEEEVGKSEDKKRYIFLKALAAQTRNPVELRSQLLHILLAGR